MTEPRPSFAPRAPFETDELRYLRLTSGWRPEDRDPLRRICSKHGQAFLNLSGYSVCPGCFGGRRLTSEKRLYTNVWGGERVLEDDD